MNRNVSGRNQLEPLAVSVTKAAEMLDVSRPKLYELMHHEDFPVFRLGGRTLISVEGLREWVRKQEYNKMEVRA